MQHSRPTSLFIAGFLQLIKSASLTFLLCHRSSFWITFKISQSMLCLLKVAYSASADLSKRLSFERRWSSANRVLSGKVSHWCICRHNSCKKFPRQPLSVFQLGSNPLFQVTNSNAIFSARSTTLISKGASPLLTCSLYCANLWRTAKQPCLVHYTVLTFDVRQNNRVLFTILC